MSFTDSSHTSAKNRKTKVMTFGTFDLFHPGHRYYLTEAKKLADTLIVVIARDTRVSKTKGKSPVDDEAERRDHVADAFPDATVILGDEQDIFAPIRYYTPDILAFGYDQWVPEEKISENFPNVSVIRIPAYKPETFKSSKIRISKNL